jgi:UDP-N-acetylglucosamine/UDP-N-acetyl-alpha-D-glucosaminouronate 4-epimerase
VRVLVTGGGGFIGSHLVERLVLRGDQVRVLDNFSSGHRSNLAPVLEDVELVEGEMQSYERASNAVRGCEAVFHLAALPSVPRSVQDPLTSHHANVTGTLNILLAARDAAVRRVLYSSSYSVYGANPQLPRHEGLTPLPISPYAVSKLAGEGYCRAFGEVYGLEAVAIRLFNVFGPRQDPRSQYAAVIPRFITALLSGRPPILFGDGGQSRDFTFVQNVVEAALVAIDVEGVAGQVYNVACGHSATVSALVRELSELIGVDVEPIYDAPRPGDIYHSVADISLARADFGYKPTVELRDGLRITVEHVRARLERQDDVLGVT